MFCSYLAGIKDILSEYFASLSRGEMELCSPCGELDSSHEDRAVSLMLFVVLICVRCISSMASTEGMGGVHAGGGQAGTDGHAENAEERKSPARDRSRSRSSVHIESGQRVRSSRSQSSGRRSRRHRSSSVESKRSRRRSYTPVRSRKRSRGRKSRKYRSSYSSYSPSPRRSRGRRHRKCRGSSSSSSPKRRRHRRRYSSPYSASPRGSRGKYSKHHHRGRSRSPSEEWLGAQRQESSRNVALQGEWTSGYGNGYGAGSWSGYDAAEQFTFHPEYPGWVVSEATGIWFPVSGPLGSVSSPAAPTVQHTLAAGTPIVPPAATGGAATVLSTAATGALTVQPKPAAGAPAVQPAVADAPEAQGCENAAYSQFEPISDIEVDIGNKAGMRSALPPPPTPAPQSQQGQLQSGSGAEEGEGSESDVFSKVLTYEQKLNRVIGVMSVQDKFKDLNWQPMKGKAKGASASMGGPGDAKDIVGLPAAPGFIMAEFDTFMTELDKLEKSRIRPRADVNFDGGPFPARPKFQASSYAMIDPPWNECFLSSPVQMIGTPLMPLEKDKLPNVPNYLVATDRLLGWEASNREDLSVVTYTDWFISTVRTMLLDMADRLARKDMSVESLDRLVVDAIEGKQILESAGRGLKDLAQSTVHRVCSQTLARRDNWIKRMTQDCPREDLVKMRSSDFNGPQLVSQELLERAQEVLQRSKTDRVHTRILSAHAENRSASDDERRQERRRYRDGSQGRRQVSYPKEDRFWGGWQSDWDSAVRGDGKDNRHNPPRGAYRRGGSDRGRSNNRDNDNRRRNESSGYSHY